MTDNELIEALKPLEPKITAYGESNAGSLNADEINILKLVYPKLQEMANNHLPRVFLTSCGSCVKTVFDVVVSIYGRET